MNTVCSILTKARYRSKLYIYLVLQENSFTSRVQPSTDKLRGDVMSMVLVLLVGQTYVASSLLF